MDQRVNDTARDTGERGAPPLLDLPVNPVPPTAKASWVRTSDGVRLRAVRFDPGVRPSLGTILFFRARGKRREVFRDRRGLPRARLRRRRVRLAGAGQVRSPGQRPRAGAHRHVRRLRGRSRGRHRRRAPAGLQGALSHRRAFHGRLGRARRRPARDGPAEAHGLPRPHARARPFAARFAGSPVRRHGHAHLSGTRQLPRHQPASGRRARTSWATG